MVVVLSVIFISVISVALNGVNVNVHSCVRILVDVHYALIVVPVLKAIVNSVMDLARNVEVELHDHDI